MSFAIEWTRRDSPLRRSRLAAPALLGCGILYALSCAFINEVVAVGLYPGYSRTSQTISELSATGAPSRPLLTVAIPLFAALMVAFGIGVWKVAHWNRALRTLGKVLVAHGATFPLWLLAPMSSRVDVVVTPVFVLTEIALGISAMARAFRFYSWATLAAIVLSGALVFGQVPSLRRGESTPWIGLLERVSIGVWLIWLVVLAVILLRRAHRERLSAW